MNFHKGFNPSILSKLSQLETLHIIAFNELTGKYLEALPKLKSLSLDYNKQFDPNILSRLPQLEKLHFYTSNKLPDEFFEGFPGRGGLYIIYCKTYHQSRHYEVEITRVTGLD